MGDSSGTCTFTVNREDWKDWGGDPGDWSAFLDSLGVDGDVWKCPHTAIQRGGEDDSTLCAFHRSPDEVPAGIDESAYLRRAIEGDDTDDHNRRRSTQFLGATFGAIELSGEPLDAGDYEPIVLAGSTFHDTVSISVDFLTPLIAPYVEFDDAADFQNVTFHGTADFRRSVFESSGDFSHVTFENGASFTNALFLAGANYWDVTFDGPTDFGHAVFEGGASFSNAVFASTAIYWDATFSDLANFGGATFDGRAHFAGATFDGRANFASVSQRTEFALPPDFSAADLEGVKFSMTDLSGGDFEEANLSDVEFSNATLLGAKLETATLSRANLFGADLRGASLAGAVLTDARIDDTTRFLHPPVDDLPVESHLPLGIATRLTDNTPVLPTCGYDPETTPPDDEKSRIEYPDRSLDKAKSVYRTIENLAGLSSRPRLEGRAFVRRQDIQREQYRRSAQDPENSRLERFIHWGRWKRASLARRIMLYGQSPWRVVGTALSIIVTFALLYPLGGWMQPTVCSADDPTTAVMECAPLTYANGGAVDTLLVIGQSLYYSTLTFTTLGFGDFRPVGFGQALTTIETVLGAVLIALLVFVLGRRAAQ